MAPKESFAVNFETAGFTRHIGIAQIPRPDYAPRLRDRLETHFRRPNTSGNPKCARNSFSKEYATANTTGLPVLPRNVRRENAGGNTVDAPRTAAAIQLSVWRNIHPSYRVRGASSQC